jgi:uncharacterized DUF497 family protein
MDPRVAGFEWDHANRDKCQKHGVSIAAIEAAFQRPVAAVPDPRHSAAEERFKAIGITDDGRHVLIVFALRSHGGETFIRPIMHRKEVRYYEEAAAKTGDR